MAYTINYIIAFFSFLIVDFAWLGFIAKSFYRDQIGHLLRDKFLLFPAFIFYLIFVFGLLIFVIVPALTDDSLAKALVFGGLFGFVTYVTYDLTNLATIRDWPLLVTIVDMVWGAVLCASVSVLTVFLSKKLGIN